MIDCHFAERQRIGKVKIVIVSTKAKALERLQRALDAIPELKQQRRGSPYFTKWRRDTEIAIGNTFGETTRHNEDFKKIRYSLVAFSFDSPDSEFQQAYVEGLDVATSILESMIDEIEEYWPDEEQAEEVSKTTRTGMPIDSKKVFIVHGRDHGTRDMLARFLEVLELEPVILQERPNQGLTIIEKFERHAQVGFAVVLFTPDDIGAVRDSAEIPQFRARQNVIFELGYLIRHLGRDRVAVIYRGDEGDIEIPSDYSGVLYTQMDDGGGWKFELIREMKSAGLDVDANKVL